MDDLNFTAALMLARSGGLLDAMRLIMPVSAVLGAGSRALLRQRVTEAVRGLGICFGETRDVASRSRIVQSSFAQYWRDWMYMDRVRLDRDVMVEGVANLDAARQGGAGVLVWEPGYFGRRFTGMRVRSELGIRPVQIHHIRHFGNDRTWVREHITRPALERLERKYNEDLIIINEDESLKSARRMSKLLAAGAVVCVSGDGYHGKRFETMKFLGGVFDFPTGPISAARLTGSRILPAFCIEEGGHRCRYVFHEPIAVPRQRDVQVELHILEHLVSLLDAWIRACPDQYRGWHGLRLAS